jgi:hypothetical protein
MSRTSASIELVQFPQPVSLPPSIKLAGEDTPPLTEDTRPINPPANAVDAEQMEAPSKGTTAIVLLSVICITGISSLLAGLVTVGLPRMAHDLNLQPSLLLWYA